MSDDVPARGDWYVEAVDAVAAAAARVHESVDAVTRELARARAARSQGTPLLDIVDQLQQAGGRDLRTTATTACEDFERAVTAYRARAIRALVDEEGLSFTTVAAHTGVSRQMVARLYRAAGPDELAELDEGTTA